MTQTNKIVLLGMLYMAISGCVAYEQDPFRSMIQGPAGFWEGVVHGLLVFPTFIYITIDGIIGLDLTDHPLAIYQINHKYYVYDLGFTIGTLLNFYGLYQVGKDEGRKGR